MRQTVLQFAQDIRYAVRQMGRARGFALTTCLTLALGIGSATAVFSVIDAALLRPLPFAHQDRIFVPDTHAIAGFDQPFSYPSYLDTRAQLGTFDALAGVNAHDRINLEGPDGAVSLAGVKGTDNFFTVFGIKPVLGRTFLPGEDQPGKDTVAVLSHEVWQSQFGGRSDAIGKVVRLDGTPYTVIGVMPAGFRYPLFAINAIYTPLHPDPLVVHSRGSHWLQTVGLVKEGVSPEQAEANFRQVMSNLAKSDPDTDAGRTVKLVPVHTAVSGTANSPLKTLAFAALALLGIACVNVAGLLLARGVKREREIALRAAVGAGRSRLVRQMVTESLVLSVAGLGLGVALAYLLLAAMRSFLVDAIARGADVSLDRTALAVAVVLAGATSVLASLAPAVRLSGTDPNRALRAGGSAGTGRGQQRLRSAFVITQVAISLVLLVVSGLLLRNLDGLMSTKLGYPPEKILAVEIDLSPGRYADRDPIGSLYEPLIERVSHLPGVQSAGIVNILPVRQWGFNEDTHISGQPPYPRNIDVTAELRFITPGYLDAMGLRLTRGRMLSPALDPYQNPAGTVLVNEAFRRKFFANGGDPVGAHLDDNEKPELKTGIVGMITDTRQDLREPPLAEMDLLASEIPPKDRISYFRSMWLIVRASGDPAQLIAPIRDALHQIDPSVPFREPETMAQILGDSLVFERMENWLFGIFAGLALLLASVGLYGLLQHEVELRTRDIGVRMALGSSRGRVVREVLTRVSVLMLIGVSAGWIVTLGLRKAISSVVEMHAAHDAALLALLTAALVAIGLLSSLIPARRAASIEPVEALRTE